MAFIIIYITHPNLEEAKKVSEHLVKQKLAACANFFPITNCYWWKGKVKSEDEFVSILKTRKENWEKVKSAVMKVHPYDVPCIMKIDVEANKEFEDWVNKETLSCASEQITKYVKNDVKK